MTFTANDRERKKMDEGKKFKKSGYLRLDFLDLEKRHSMLNYINGGCEIGLTVAIDYTASNGKPACNIYTLRYRYPSINLYTQVWDSPNNFGYDLDIKHQIADSSDVQMLTLHL